MKKRRNRWILVWLYCGLIMIFVQFVIGGITRLTDSGLSITEWEVIEGVIPPVSEVQWNVAFEKYQVHASQQFESLHVDMSLTDFKKIYYWEWFHRFWARLMGFVFFLPLVIFISKGWIGRALGLRLAGVFLFALGAAILGWIMVKSGLNNDQRTWVSAYKLISHLGIGILLLGWLYWTILHERDIKVVGIFNIRHYRFAIILTCILLLQIVLGGLMAGMRAALLFPFYPLLNQINVVMESLLSFNINTELIDYEASIGIKAIVQLAHRVVGVVFLGMSFLYLYTLGQRSNGISKVFVGVVLLQYLFGIMTVIHSQTGVPVAWGVIHQGTSLILLILLLEMVFRYKVGKSRNNY